MLSNLLSQDLPRSKLLGALLLLIVVGLLATPFIFPGARSMNVGAKIAVFIVLAASYDLMLGYTGIVSFAHTMFFGIGAYGIGIASTQMGPTWTAMTVGLLVAVISCPPSSHSASACSPCAYGRFSSP
jgi:branched-chain amino acid transport system permease protein